MGCRFAVVGGLFLDFRQRPLSAGALGTGLLLFWFESGAADHTCEQLGSEAAIAQNRRPTPTHNPAHRGRCLRDSWSPAPLQMGISLHSRQKPTGSWRQEQGFPGQQAPCREKKGLGGLEGRERTVCPGQFLTRLPQVRQTLVPVLLEGHF